MKKSALAMVITLISASVCLPTASYADGPGGGHNGQDWHPRNGGGHQGNGGPGREGGHPGNGGQGGQGGQGGHDNRDHGAPHAAPHGAPHGGDRDHFAWRGHDFRRGHPVPSYYRGERYRVADWRAHGLYEPPRGYQWSYIDGNYVLMAVATGVITSIIVESLMHN